MVRALLFLTKIVVFVFFAAFVMRIIDYFLGMVKDYSFSNVDPCVGYFMNLIGFGPAISIFLKILAIGFLVKHSIAYLRSAF